MAGVLPSNVSFFMQRLQGVSTSHFKVFPQSSDNGTSGKILRFELPSNSLVNMRNLRLFFNASTSGAGASLPNDISSLIERVAIYMGGVLVQNNFQHYNVLKHAKASIKKSYCNAALGHPNIVRATSYHDGNGIADTSPEAYADKDDQFCVDNWEGLLGSIEPSIIDTGLLPQITLEITLADDTVCPISSGRTMTTFVSVGSGNPTYSLSNISVQVEVLGMATSVLDQIVEQRISSVGYLSLPFKNYFTFVSTHTGTSRFNVNSASWDRLWLAYRPTTYAAKAAPAIAAGYKKDEVLVEFGRALVNGAVSSSTTLVIDNATGGAIKVGDVVRGTGISGVVTITAKASATSYTMSSAQSISDNVELTFQRNIGGPQYDLGGVLGTNEEKYLSKYFVFAEDLVSNSTPASHQLQVNSASVPAYRMTTTEALSMSLGAVDGEINKDMTLDQYKNNYFVQCYRFCLSESDFNRLASGLDTRSVSAMGSVETEGLNTSNLTMFAECTSELRVGSGRAIEIIN